MKKFAKFFILTIVLSSSVYSSAKDVSGVFLLIYPGAQATSLGGAYSAIGYDATALYYNPALVNNFRGKTFSLVHANWLPALAKDMYYEYFGAVFPSGPRVAYGIYIAYLSLGKIEGTNERGEPIGSWTPHDFALSFVYGSRIRDNFSFGGTFKYIRSFLAPRNVMAIVVGVPEGGTANTFALDAGLNYKKRFNLFKQDIDFSYSLAFQNYLSPGIRYTGQGKRDKIPELVRTGVALGWEKGEIYSFLLSLDYTKVTVNLQNDLKEKGAWWVFAVEPFKHVGLQIGLLNLMYLRAGYFIDWDGSRVGLTFGGGIRFKNFSLDFADDSRIYAFNETANYRFSLTYYAK